ncbi:MAG: NAD(P)H-hydrate dehydratase [Fimbriimonadaceae bacterium]
MWIATAQDIRAIDRCAVEHHCVPTRVLMERAGTAVFHAVRELAPHHGRIGVVCGKGNNGGDGFVVARLAKRKGYDVYCAVAAEENDLSQDADEQMRTAVAEGVSPVFCNDPRFARMKDCLSNCDVVVDALLGTGIQGEVQGHVKGAIHAINQSGAPVVSVDVPSGLHTDTGEELGESVWAARTVTFGLPKPYLFQGIGVDHAGYWTVDDLGLPYELLAEPRDAKLLEGTWIGNVLPERMKASHKGQHGSVLIVAGSRNMPGAAVLAAKGALRAGAGLVTVAGVPNVCQAVAMQVPEALCLVLPDEDGVVSPSGAEAVLGRMERTDAALFGPGLTHEDAAMRFLESVWQGWTRPAVIDADALNSVSLGVAPPRAPMVMTPHPGEMSRLLQQSIGEIQCDRFSSLREALERYGCTMLLKGAYSLVGEPGRPILVNCTGNPGMATGGMGDVLGGVVATLAAQEVEPYYAAAAGMFWHGLAGDVCASAIGTIGFTASEVADALPNARAKITTSCCPR